MGTQSISPGILVRGFGEEPRVFGVRVLHVNPTTRADREGLGGGFVVISLSGEDQGPFFRRNCGFRREIMAES